MTCSYRSSYSDSGDRGADMHEHYRAFHPDHVHVWEESAYAWEECSVIRCTICSLRESDDAEGKCS